jgi:hypothetical protein
MTFGFKLGLAPLDERGEDLTGAAILRKRRAFEAANPSYPKWQGETHMSDIRKDHTHEWDGIIADANEGRCGRDATFLKLRQHFERYHHSMTDLGKDGNPRSVEQQMESHFAHSPRWKAAALAVKNALLDTASEKRAALEAHGRGDLADLHEHERDKHPSHGEHVGATKIDKNVQFGPNAALSVTNNPAVGRVMRMAERLQKRLKAEKQIEMSKEQCFNFLAQNSETAKALLKLDKAIRLGPSFADPADYEAAVR